MSEFDVLRDLLLKKIKKARETVQLASNETLPYELFKLITLEELSDDVCSEKRIIYGVTELEFQFHIKKKMADVDDMIRCSAENSSYDYDPCLKCYIGMRDACEIVNALANKVLGHWVEPEKENGKDD